MGRLTDGHDAIRRNQPLPPASSSAHRGPTTSAAGSPQALLDLQRSAGNAAVGRLLTAQRQAAGGSGSGTGGSGKDAGGTGSTAGPPTALDDVSRAELDRHGLTIGDAEQRELVQAFPNGFRLESRPDVVLALSSGSSLDLVRMAGLRVVPPAPLVKGVEAWFFQVGKGRAVLLSSPGGPSTMLDAGSGTSLSANAAGVQRLVAAVGLVTSTAAAVPSSIRISHADADHYNAVRSLLSQAGFAATSVEVAVGQLRATGSFSRASLTVQPAQQIVEIDVLAGGPGAVHSRRTVVGNMELTEFRLVAPHRAAAGGQTYNRNATSPVTVVVDLVTGERSVYTADAPGRAFDTIVNTVGEAAFRRLLGADGRNLRVAELPHHGGAQTGPDAAGLLRLLQLSFEAGRGDLRLLTQTSQSFASGASASISFLDNAGVAPERIGPDPSPAGRADVTRARGSAVATVTIDAAGIQQVVSVAQANQTRLQQTYARLAEIGDVRVQAGAMAESLARAGAPEQLLSSVRATHQTLVDQQRQLSGAADAVWDAMRTAAGGTGGMRGSRDMTDVNARMTALGASLSAADPATAVNDMRATERGLENYARVWYTVAQMVAALSAERFEDVHRLRAVNREQIRALRAVLGSQTYSEHVKAAWDATRTSWATDRIESVAETMTSRVVQRKMSAEFRARLTDSLGRQEQLNSMVEQASHAGRQVYGPGGTRITPASTRVGAGVLAAIEVVRIGLEIADSARAAAEASDLAEIRSAREGIAAVNWWMRRGVQPDLALVKRHWFSGAFEVVSAGLSQETMRSAARGESPTGVPDFDKIVVTAVDPGELRRMVVAMEVALPDLGAWVDLNRSYPTGEAFKKFDEGWGVRLWDREENGYRYVSVPEVGPDLDRVLQSLEESQADRFESEAASAEPGTIHAVKDSAWIGVDRDMYVYTDRGGWHHIDVEDFSPHVVKVGLGFAPNSGSRSHFMQVKAADLRTFQLLSRYAWVSGTGARTMGRDGLNSEQLTVGPNSDGYAWVDPDDLVTTQSTALQELGARASRAGSAPAR